MVNEFADWVHDIIHSTKGRYLETLRAWEQASNQMVASLELREINDLVALSFNASADQVSSAERLRACFKQADPGFRIRDDYALRVLSGVVLLSLLRTNPETAVQSEAQCFAATAVLSCSLGLTRADCRPNELLSVAVDFVNDQAAQRRKIAPVNFVGDVNLIKKAQRRLKAMAKTSSFGLPQAKELSSIIEPVVDLLPTIPDLLHNQNILQEESDMAWWVQAGHSRTLERPLDEVPEALLPIVIGLELAERTRVLPSGNAARFLITHLLKLNGHRNLEVSLLELPLENHEAWVEEVLKVVPLTAPRVTPLLFLLSAWRDRGLQWHKDYASSSGIAPETRLPAEKVGYAFYQECLTSRQLVST
jgi:hypothetical protein